MEGKDMVCIVCPLGCKLKVYKSDGNQAEYAVQGNKCFRGAEYGIKEMTNPTRVLTTTVAISGAAVRRLPVRSSGAIPKQVLEPAMEFINKVKVAAPIQMGQTIIENILNTGVDIVASKST